MRYKLNTDKINTLEDVIQVLKFLGIQYDVQDGTYNPEFNMVQMYFDIDEPNAICNPRNPMPRSRKNK